MDFEKNYHNKQVLVTGHTGFKGAWLCEWLLMLGAKVTGLALKPETRPSLYEMLDLDSRLDSILGDIRDAKVIESTLNRQPYDFIFHMAAQPLVRRSYQEPVLTFETNVMGTVHLLNALRGFEHPCAVVVVTTDKCYENKEWPHGYRESDPLGGRDPYSASKACAEMVTHAYRQSYFGSDSSPVGIASARAGNVIGGGDYAQDRIVPDCVRALASGQGIQVRNPSHTRPWQHVLEPLGGYLLLASKLKESTAFHTAFNFGPHITSNRSVKELVTEMLLHWPGKWEKFSATDAPHEAGLLHLSHDKASTMLGWQPRWNFQQTIRATVDWYQAFSHESYPPDQVSLFMQNQIRSFLSSTP